MLLQQIPGHRLSAEAVDRWLDFATDMGFHIGTAFDGVGKVYIIDHYFQEVCSGWCISDGLFC